MSDSRLSILKQAESSKRKEAEAVKLLMKEKAIAAAKNVSVIIRSKKSIAQLIRASS